MDPMCIRAFVFCAAISVAVAVGGLTFECTSDDVVHVSGFPPDTNFFAMQGSAQCNVTVRKNGTSICISDCSKDQEILVTYGSYADMETNSLHGGITVNAVKVTCNEIPEAGNEHNITNTFAANLTIDETQAVDPTYSVTSNLSSTSVNVGDQITWTIYFPVEYRLEVTECTANPGLSYVAANNVDLISSGGCDVSSELISNFTDNGDGTASATIEAFKFYNNDNVFLTCDLKICPNDSTQCDTTCLSVSKRDVHSIVKRSDRQSETERFYPGRVHDVLTVIDPNENSAMAVTPFGWSFDQDILVTYGSYADMETNQLHAGKTVNAVIVTCNEIPDAGNTHNITDTFAANLTIDETQAVDPTYTVTSNLSSTSVYVGDQITWTIYFPVEYRLEVTSCTANPGLSYAAADEVDLISTGGCDVSSELISNFTDNGDGTLSATIEAFKFYNNDNVFLTCDLKICPNDSSQCDVTCLSVSKRDVHSIVKRSDRESETTGFYPGRVHDVLTVIDPNENSAMAVTPFGWSFVFTLVILICSSSTDPL